MRVALKIAYSGKEFLGSQPQTETDNTVLGTIERVLSALGIQERLIASGRTDKGVHAQAQLAHLDLPEFWQDFEKLKRTINTMLPSSISIKRVTQVSKTFHARYSAKKRGYRYIIKEGDSNPFEADFVTFLQTVDFEDIEKKIKVFTGEHDFKNFMKTGSQTNSSIRVIYQSFAYRHKDYIILKFQANGFLRSQIRLMVGALLQLNKEQIEEKLEGKKNHHTKPAPPNGLYLSSVSY